MKFLSVVVVTYNSQDIIFDCLTSVFSQDEDNIEVIVVDNNSNDDTIKIVKNNFSKVILIQNKNNLGYGLAINQGIRKADSEYILTCNADIILEKNFIKNLSIQLEHLPGNIGMLSPKIKSLDGRIDSTGLFLSRLRRLYDRGRGCNDENQFELPTYIFGPCGACAVYKREMLEDIKIGDEYFDEDFFLFVEDFDIAWRANLFGWVGYFLPEIKCFHRGGVSRIRSKLSQYYTFRNRYLLLIKNESVNGLLRLCLFAWIYDLYRIFYLLLMNNYILRVFREIKQLLPIMIKKRSYIEKRKNLLIRVN